ncbi:MAG: folylpolyglutamate synthase/dihydrofolate synthase family protein [Myxococcota bacterium]
MIRDLFPRAAGGFKLGLDDMRALVEALGRPDRRYRCIVVAGTNGKGSTCHGLAWLLRQAGDRVGLYTSPHLLRFAERFRVDGEVLDDDTLIRTYERVKSADAARSASRPASFFELGTAMALVAFAEAQVDWAVLEVGLGGRLDATNVVERDLSVITPVGFDHQRYLGDTLAEIAGEKAGILAPGVPLVLAPQEPEADAVIRAAARALGTPLFELPTARRRPLELARDLAQRAARALGVSGGLSGTEWHPPARYQRLPGPPPVILDAAHNLPAVQALVSQLREEAGPVHAVFNVLPDRPRGRLVALLNEVCATVRVPTFDGAPDSTGPTIEAALGEAQEAARSDGGMVLIAGSFQLLAEAVHRLTGAPRDPTVRG